MSGIEFNPFSGTFDFTGSGGTAAPDNFSYDKVVTTVTIPIHQQMIVHQAIQVDDILIINGTLVIL